MQLAITRPRNRRSSNIRMPSKVRRLLIYSNSKSNRHTSNRLRPHRCISRPLRLPRCTSTQLPLHHRLLHQHRLVL